MMTAVRVLYLSAFIETCIYNTRKSAQLRRLENTVTFSMELSVMVNGKKVVRDTLL